MPNELNKAQNNNEKIGPAEKSSLLYALGKIQIIIHEMLIYCMSVIF